MLARSSLETQKLELMADVADMKRRQALMERQHMEIHDRAQRSEAELANMVMQVSPTSQCLEICIDCILL
jgi:hypothetical protein